MTEYKVSLIFTFLLGRMSELQSSKEFGTNIIVFM